MLTCNAHTEGIEPDEIEVELMEKAEIVETVSGDRCLYVKGCPYPDGSIFLTDNIIKVKNYNRRDENGKPTGEIYNIGKIVD